MRALTLIRPWPWAMLYGPKRIENRGWAPSPATLPAGERFGVHAGAGWDEEGAAFIREVCKVSEPEHFRDQGLVGSLVFRDVLLSRIPAEVERAKLMGQSVWFFGPKGWVCESPIIFKKPIPCGGSRSLWVVPPEIERLVLQ